MKLMDTVRLRGNPQCVGIIVGKRYGRPMDFSLKRLSPDIEDVRLGMGGLYFDVRMDNGTILHGRHESSLEIFTEPFTAVSCEVVSFPAKPVRAVDNGDTAA